MGSLALTGTYQNFRLPEGKQMVNIKTHILFIEAGIMCRSIWWEGCSSILSSLTLS